MKKSLGWLIGILVVVLILFTAFISISNNFIRKEEAVNNSWAEVDNQLQRRSDLIPNLVETVKGYTKHEQAAIEAVAEARSRLAGAATPEAKMEANNQLDQALSRLLVVVENYPDLKASEQFTNLQYELAGSENRLAVARKRYNDAVREYNVAIRVFPGSIVASIKGLTAKQMWEASPEARQTPKVEF
ncbi:MAG: LemA family protein [Firmicutes bacterium]|nr:LemA family protein [Bacillota bacterium]HOB23196.1 LemA family protein [Bacillota bacterium]HQD40415.1 LemA family protein [Bacillota bacterium]